MAIYSNLQDYKFGESGEDIRGSKVYGANGEKLGEMIDVIFDTGSGEIRYVVVDSGGWLATATFVIPTRQLMTRDKDEDYKVSINKDQVRKLPQFRQQDLESEERWSDYENRYEAAWVEDPVLHREGSTHTVTPDPSEDPVAASSSKVFKNATPRRIAHEVHEYVGVDAVIPRQASEEVVQEVPETDKMDSGRAPVTRGGRLKNFEERLRKERDKILRRRKAA